jgi:predicted aldo/keto reductase-like oxidoreductase
MIYRNFGKTGARVSALGFGGMRFGAIDDRDACVAMMVKAAEGGVNYFDTAPAYFGVKSEAVFGEGLAELRRRKLPYYLATKTGRSEEKAIREQIEGQLERLKVEAIDFYHVWCVTSLPEWEERKRKGIVDTFRRLKDEGLVRHICVSSHLIGDEINELLREDVFEGVLFGYSAYNYRTRRAAFDAIRTRGLGCAVMNPLGGGIIPQHPELFEALKAEPGESAVEAALRFLFAHEDISTVLVGFENDVQVAEGLRAVEGFRAEGRPSIAELESRLTASFEGICTGCQYCDDCPEDIPIPKLMDAYNQKIFQNRDKAILERLDWHWNLSKDEAAKCIACGRCEAACTQHIPIMQRLEEIAALEVPKKV